MGVMWNATAEKVKHASAEGFAGFVGVMIFLFLFFIVIMTVILANTVFANA